jgi:Flp pilus assembly protein TadB
VIGTIAAALATAAGLLAVSPQRTTSLSKVDLIRASVLAPAEWEQQREARRSWYLRWLLPALRLLSRRLPQRPPSLDPVFLIQAGVDPEVMTVSDLRALRIACAAGGLLSCLALAAVWPTALFLLPLLVWSGLVLPERILVRRRAGRERRVRKELPDFIGLLRALTTAGLSLERAIQVLGEHPRSTPLLSAEARRAMSRYGLGLSLEGVLEELSERIGVREVAMFTSAVVQARRTGGGFSNLLRDQELLARMSERNRATAEASRVSTRLLAVLAGIYLPEFVLLIMIPLFWGIMRRAFG